MSQQPQNKNVLLPERSAGLWETYSEGSITKKNTNKEHLLAEFGMAKHKKVLVVVVLLTKKWEELEQDEKEVLQGIYEAFGKLSYICPVYAVQQGDTSVRDIVKDAQIIEYKDGIDNVRLLSGSDVFVFIEKKPNRVVENLNTILEFGDVPVFYKEVNVPQYVLPYNPFKEEGAAFIYTSYDVWNILGEVVKIHEVYKFAYDWNTIRRRSMSLVTT